MRDPKQDPDRRPAIEAHIRAVKDAWFEGFRWGCVPFLDGTCEEDLIERWPDSKARALLAHSWPSEVEAVDRQDAAQDARGGAHV